MRIGQDEADRLSLLLDRPVDIAPDALIMLARIALHKGLGARWMKSKIGTMIDDMIYDDPDAPRIMCSSMSRRTQTNADRKNLALIELIRLDRTRNRITKRPSVIHEQLQIVRFLLAKTVHTCTSNSHASQKSSARSCLSSTP